MKYFFILFFIFSSLSSKAQRGEYTDAIELLTGFTRFSIAGNNYHVGYIYHINDKWYFKFNGFYSYERYDGEDGTRRFLYHEVFGGDAYIGYTILEGLEKKFVWYSFVGITGSLERGNWEGRDYNYLENNAGVLFGTECEYYLSPRFSLVGHINQHIVGLKESRWGYLRWYANAGIRYHFRWKGNFKRDWVK